MVSLIYLLTYMTLIPGNGTAVKMADGGFVDEVEMNFNEVFSLFSELKSYGRSYSTLG